MDSRPSGNHTTGASETRTHRVLNYPLLIGTLVVIVVVSPLVYALHAYQVRNISDAFRSRADRLMENEEWHEAAHCLLRYLQLEPDDADVRILLAETYDRSAEDAERKHQAVEYYYRALGVAPREKQPELRRRLTELLLETARWQEAEQEANALLETDPDDTVAHRVLALARYQHERKTKSAVSFNRDESPLMLLERASALDSGDVGLASCLASLYRDETMLPHHILIAELRRAFSGSIGVDSTEETAAQSQLGVRIGRCVVSPEEYGDVPTRFLDDAASGSPVHLDTLLRRVYRGGAAMSATEEHKVVRLVRQALADDVIDQMVAARPDDPDAYLARHLYRMQYGEEITGNDLDKLLQLDPEHQAGLGIAAQFAESQQDWDQARELYTRLTKVAPEAAEAYARIGHLMVRSGQSADAVVEHFETARERCGDQSLTVARAFAECLIALGRVDDSNGQTSAQPVLEEFSKLISKQGLRMPRRLRNDIEARRDALWAAYHIARREYALAVPRLKNAILLLDAIGHQDAQRLASLHGQLGRAYDALGQPDAAAAVYAEAADAGSPEHAMAAGHALLETRQLDRAAAMFRRAIDATDAPEAWLGLAQARFAQQQATPRPGRDWTAVEQALAGLDAAHARDPIADAWRIAVLKMNLATLRVDASDAAQAETERARLYGLLQDSEATFGDSPDFLAWAVSRYELLEYPKDADRVLARLKELSPASAAPYLSESQLELLRDNADAALAALETGLESIRSEQELASLQREFVKLTLRFENDSIDDAWVAALPAATDDLEVVSQLCEKALREKDQNAAARWEQKLRELEGGEGSLWRFYRSSRLADQAASTDDPEFVEAVKLYEQLLRLRPTWYKTHSLGGTLHARRGDIARAVDSYERAIELGDQRIQVFERLVALLYHLQNYEKVDRVLAQLHGRDAAASGTLSEFRIRRATQEDRLEEALRAAEQGIALRPDDPAAHFWHAQVLRLMDREEEAEAALQEVVRVAADDPNAMLALFTFYAKEGRTQEAEQMLEQIAATIDSSENKAFLLAQGYTVLGDLDRAKQQFREAVRLAPDNVDLLRRLAKLVSADDPAEAETLLRRALQIEPDNRSVRRMLAALLADTGGEQAWEEIERLLAASGDDSPATAEDLRLQAKMLFARGGKQNLAKSKTLLDGLIDDPRTSTDEDHLLMAKIFAMEGDVEAARDHYLPLASRKTPSAAHLSLFIDFLLRFDRASEAATWLARLEGLPEAKDQLSTIALKVRTLEARGAKDEAKRVLESFAAKRLAELDGDDQVAQFALAVGNIYSSVEYLDDAEAWYRKIIDVAPRRFEPLAMCLAKKGEVDKAIALCRQEIEATGPVVPAVVLASMAASQRLSPQQLEALETIFAQAIEEAPDNTQLLMAVANARVVQEEIDEAVTLYRKILETHPKSPVVLNNLATLLAETPSSRDEALAYIDKAIGVEGPKDPLLDTKAMILVQKGMVDEAVLLLEAACAHHAPDPRYLFHLAVAYQGVGQTAKARQAFEEALDSGLEDQILTTSDKQMLEQLEHALLSPKEGDAS